MKINNQFLMKMVGQFRMLLLPSSLHLLFIFLEIHYTSKIKMLSSSLILGVRSLVILNGIKILLLQGLCFMKTLTSLFRREISSKFPMISISYTQKEGLKICQDLKLQKQLKWEMHKTKKELETFCQ